MKAPHKNSAISNAISSFSARQDGNMSLTYGDMRYSLDNRKAFLKKINIDSKDIIVPQQIHGGEAALVTAKDKGFGALSHELSIKDADALITNEPYIPISILTADCLSIFIFDKKNKVIGLAHAGWRGTYQKVAIKTIDLMREKFGSRPYDLSVNFGPSIRKCCYKVDKEFKEYFPGEISVSGSFYYFDLAAANRRQIIKLGVAQDQISDCQICTSCSNDRYFSYRKEGSSCGRIISVMMLK